MAVLPQFGGLPEALARDDYGALLPSAKGNNGYYRQYDNCAAVVSAAQSELTCNCGGGGVVLPSRKRGREAEIGIEQFASSSSALLPVPGMLMEVGVASTSRRAAEPSVAGDELVSELRWYGAEVDALVRAECDRMRAGLGRARMRQRLELARSAAARRLREKEAELGAARRRAAELEERVRQEAAESQAWRGAARANEAVAAGLRAALDRRRSAPPVEGFGESEPVPFGEAAADDAQSEDSAGASPAASSNKRECRACGEREASVLLLPCRHLSLCKACERRVDACPACLAVKNASIHIAEN
jgi:E3 ubiquitin-protein ligase BOI and related proteins